jgi:pyruvate,water dikinase
MAEKTEQLMLINELKERAKELNCLYEIQELLIKPNITEEELLKGIVDVIPPGWAIPGNLHGSSHI